MIRTALSWLSPGGASGRLSILIFHRVFARHDPLAPGEVVTAEFDAICCWLNAWCAVLPLADAVVALKEGRLPRRAVALTFDDGYRDNHDQALPVLQRHGLRATFFVASGFLDGGRMWNDTVIESVRRSPASELDMSGSPLSAMGRLPLGTDDQRRRAIAALIGGIKYLPTAQREDCVAAVAERAGADLPADLMMTREQVRALHEAGMAIGAHTRTHPILRGLKRAAVEDEIEGNCSDLQTITGVRPALFAYPNGRPLVDYDDASVEAVRAFGFAAAVSTTWRAARVGDDLFQLPRYMPWERSRSRFALRLGHTLATT